MNKLDNIQSTKEYGLAKQVENTINSYSFDPAVFAATIPYMHRTLQQLLWKLIKECIKVIADDRTGHDDRNMASHLEAKEMLEYLKEHGRYIPHI